MYMFVNLFRHSNGKSTTERVVTKNMLVKTHPDQTSWSKSIAYLFSLLSLLFDQHYFGQNDKIVFARSSFAALSVMQLLVFICAWELTSKKIHSKNLATAKIY
jgi:hypothetical protein